MWPMSAAHWSDEIDGILDGDLTTGLAYVTPAGGAVVTTVASIGLRDRSAGTVSFTTSLGFGRKLERIRRNPRVALCYHSREHGFSSSPRLVLLQGRVNEIIKPEPDYVEQELTPRVVRYLGPLKRGRLFWDRWLREYYQDRVLVTVGLARIVVWPDAEAGGDPEVIGEPLPAAPPSQTPPRGGTGPRVDSLKAARRLGALPHRLLGFTQSDGYPAILPVDVTAASGAGLTLQQPGGWTMPPGGRRACLFGHAYRPKLIGLKTRQYTGWLLVDDAGNSAVFAPHTEKGFVAPPNKTLLLLLNGLVAKIGLRRARRAGRADLLDRHPQPSPGQ